MNEFKGMPIGMVGSIKPSIVENQQSLFHSKHDESYKGHFGKQIVIIPDSCLDAPIAKDALLYDNPVVSRNYVDGLAVLSNNAEYGTLQNTMEPHEEILEKLGIPYVGIWWSNEDTRHSDEEMTGDLRLIFYGMDAEGNKHSNEYVIQECFYNALESAGIRFNDTLLQISKEVGVSKYLEDKDFLDFKVSDEAIDKSFVFNISYETDIKMQGGMTRKELLAQKMLPEYIAESNILIEVPELGLSRMVNELSESFEYEFDEFYSEMSIVQERETIDSFFLEYFNIDLTEKEHIFSRSCYESELDCEPEVKAVNLPSHKIK